NIQTMGMAAAIRQERAAIERSARVAAMKSPHAIWLAKMALKSGDTSPGTMKFIPKNRNALKAARSLNASLRPAHASSVMSQRGVGGSDKRRHGLRWNGSGS